MFELISLLPEYFQGRQTPSTAGSIIARGPESILHEFQDRQHVRAS